MAVKFLCIAFAFFMIVEMGFCLPVTESPEDPEDSGFSGTDEGPQIPDCTDSRAAICHLSGCTKVFRKECFGSILDLIKTNIQSFMAENNLEAVDLKTTATEFTLEASVCPSKGDLYELFQGLCSARLTGDLPKEILEKCDCPF